LKRLKSNTIAQIAVVGFLSYWVLWFGLGAMARGLGLERTNNDIMLELCSGLVLGAAPILTYTWFTSAVQALKEGGKDDYSFLNFAIFTICGAITYQQLWITTMRWLGRPEWMLESALRPLATWSIFFGLVILMMAPETKEGTIPVKNWWLLLATALIGTSIASVTVGFFLGQAVS